MSRTALIVGVLAALAATSAAAASGSLRLARQPYAGVRCAQPNSIVCDRIGLAVWLVRPAARLTATIAGKPIRMAIPARIRSKPTGYYLRAPLLLRGSAQTRGLLEAGPFHVTPDAGRYYWESRHPRPLRVHLVASYRDGGSASTTVRIWLHPGWG
jgi:hypothetical protein